MTDSAAAATTTLRRHNSIASSVSVPTKITLPATPLRRTTSMQPPQNQNTQKPHLNLELVSFSSYTSLRDVLPSPNAAVNSPTGYDISIRNRLIKQAAWAYLRPMYASPSTSSAPHFLRRFSSACLGFLCHQLVPAFARIFRRILHSLRGHVTTS